MVSIQKPFLEIYLQVGNLSFKLQFTKFFVIDVQLNNFFIVDPSLKNIEISLDLVNKFKIEKNLNFNVMPVIVDEEIWPFASDKLDLVVSSLNLHWVNDIQATLVRILDSLEPDGALIGN